MNTFGDKLVGIVKGEAERLKGIEQRCGSTSMKGKQMIDLNSMEVASTPLVDPMAEADRRREEWFEKRRGKFTCSRFGDLIASGSKKDDVFSKTGLNYIYQVAGERLGSFVHEFDSRQTQWGKDHEAEALNEYAAELNLDAGEFVTGEDTFSIFGPTCAGTPDALIRDDGCAEVKCPYTPTEHIGHLRAMRTGNVPDKYFWQCAGHLLVTGRQFVDFISFDPRIERSTTRLGIVRMKRSDVESRIAILIERLALAEKEVQRVVAELTE